MKHRFWWRRRKELDEELRNHFEMAVRERIERGEDSRRAREAAQREFGNAGLVRETTRDAWGWRWLENFLQDLRFGARTLRKNPGFTIVAVLTLALGIGTNTAIFTILNAAILRPLPVPNAGQLVAISQTVGSKSGALHRNVQEDSSLVSYSEYRRYAQDNRVFSGLLAYSPFLQAILGRSKPQLLMGSLASCNYFDVLEVHPSLGRFFTDSDCTAPAASPVVVISDNLWRTTFGANESIIGKPITLNGTSWTVVGVAPPGFNGTLPFACRFWLPLTMESTIDHGGGRLNDNFLSWLALIGRLKPGVSERQAAADLNVIAARSNQLQPGRVTSVALSPATLVAIPSFRTAVWAAGAVLMAAVGLVLLIACVNIANLLFARAIERRKEIAVRLAVGASRGRLIRQMLTEGLLLAFLGGAAGVMLSMWTVALIFQFAVSHLPTGPAAIALSMSPDFRTWIYTFGLATATAFLFALAPALRSSQMDLALAMKEEGAEAASKFGRGRLRGLLVGTQVGMCTFLLLISGLLLRGLYHAQTIDPGFQTKNIESVSFDLGRMGYDSARSVSFQRQFAERIAALPGVSTVAEAESTPLDDDHRVKAYSPSGAKEEFFAEYNLVSPSFFTITGIPILQGRDFTEAEYRAGAHLAVVPQFTARRMWPGKDPIGQTIQEGVTDWQVVGVARDAQVATLGDSTKLYLYLLASPSDQPFLKFMVRGAAPSPSLEKEITGVVAEIDPNMPVFVAPLADNLEHWLAPSRVVSALSATLGGLALLLAIIGIYGMVSYTVSRRVREIGIRIALGAEKNDVAWLVIRQGMVPVVAGALVAILCGAFVSSFLSILLYGISPWDPAAFSGVATMVVIVALLASYIPARRAMRVDPMVALRYE